MKIWTERIEEATVLVDNIRRWTRGYAKDHPYRIFFRQMESQRNKVRYRRKKYFDIGVQLEFEQDEKKRKELIKEQEKSIALVLYHCYRIEELNEQFISEHSGWVR